MGWLEVILSNIVTLILGGGLATFITLRSVKKKAEVEVKVDEIQALHNTIEQVYQPMITQLNTRVKELEGEVTSLRKQLQDERADHQKELDMMNRRILAITSALGLKASEQIRDERGRYAKAPETIVNEGEE